MPQTHREDCTFLTDAGKFNYRVAAYIEVDGRILMASNPNEPYEFYYSVGGRVYLGETMQEAVERELLEETGIACKVDKIIGIHENFFTDAAGTPYHEVSMFYKIEPNESLRTIKDGHLTDKGPDDEYLKWIDKDNPEGKTIYPIFFLDKDFGKDDICRHYITRDGKTVLVSE